MRRAVATLVALAWSVVAAAAEPTLPILDAAAVPYLNPQGRASYAEFLLMNLPRAFALSSSGMYGWHGGGRAIEQERAAALKSCTDKGGTDCAIYAEDLRVVWPGRPAVDPPVVPGPLIEGRYHAFIPDPRFIWRGPQAARGVLVWAHGKSGQGEDLRGEQPQAYVRAFNNAGFDVVRFDRMPSVDRVEDAADWLRQGLPTLRAKGWRMVIAAGQSRGAWNSLQMLETPGLADAVIAVSPASFTGIATQGSDFHRILRNAKSPAARVVVAQFKGDTYVQYPDDRAGEIRDLLPPRVAALLLIDQPAGITGHGGGGSADFARRYGPCLLRFVTDPVPPDCGVGR